MSALLSLTPTLPAVAYTPSTYTPVVGQTVSFNGSASTATAPGASLVGYRWVWGDGTPDASGRTATHAFATAGKYSVGLFVTDSLGLTAAAGHGITAGPPPPTVAFSPSTYTPVVGQIVSFNGSASTATAPGASLVGYRWVWGDGTPDASGSTATHAFAAAGKVSVGLYVTDSLGATAAVGHGITVGPPPPAVTFSPSTYTPVVGQTVSFSGSASVAPGATIVGYRWVWGDGTPDGSGPTATHAFASPGKLSVALYVTDSLGAVGAEGHTITISAPI
ncbi:MAG: PKD domain-containing protein [Actinobacteria bacterium]|nr:PKD domain-containing protein [Actinomycetota bacterium]